MNHVFSPNKRFHAATPASASFAHPQRQPNHITHNRPAASFDVPYCRRVIHLVIVTLFWSDKRGHKTSIMLWRPSTTTTTPLPPHRQQTLTSYCISAPDQHQPPPFHSAPPPTINPMLVPRSVVIRGSHQQPSTQHYGLKKIYGVIVAANHVAVFAAALLSKLWHVV